MLLLLLMMMLRLMLLMLLLMLLLLLLLRRRRCPSLQSRLSTSRTLMHEMLTRIRLIHPTPTQRTRISTTTTEIRHPLIRHRSTRHLRHLMQTVLMLMRRWLMRRRMRRVGAILGHALMTRWEWRLTRLGRWGPHAGGVMLIGIRIPALT